MPKLPAWAELESRLAELPRLGVAAVCQRAAGRRTPAIALAEPTYGPVAVEWLNAIAAVLRVVEAGCAGGPVSRFTLDIAAEVARGTANSARNAVREKGPSVAAEGAEMSFAAAAFAVDVLRSAEPKPWASVAVQCLRIAIDGGTVPEPLVGADYRLLVSLAGVENTDWTATADGPFGEVWPFGEPDWVTTGLARLRELEPVLPNWLRLPGG